MSTKLFLALVFLAVTLIGQKQDRQVKPPTPASAPEVAKTVEAINGTWLGKMSVDIPSFPTEAFDWTMNCRIVAHGAGASCTNTGRASIGSMAESCLLAFDPEGKAVHYMCVTSMGEVHDHKGNWKDEKTIEFEPLRAGMAGQLVTETLRWHFPDANTIEKSSLVLLADGSSMNFQFKGRRQ